MSETEDRLLTVRDVAERLRVSEEWVRIAVADGRLREIRLGDTPRAHMRFALAEIERFIRDGEEIGQ